jgi:putative hydrolase of the HAD superfamily
MGSVGILDFFSMRMYSYEFDCRKPNPRIFRIAAEKIGAAVENILFVGDRIEKDIRPALNCGMAAALKIAYTNAGKAIPRGAHRIRLLSELPDLIESIHSEPTPQRCQVGSLETAR